MVFNVLFKIYLLPVVEAILKWFVNLSTRITTWGKVYQMRSDFSKKVREINDA